MALGPMNAAFFADDDDDDDEAAVVNALIAFFDHAGDAIFILDIFVTFRTKLVTTVGVPAGLARAAALLPCACPYRKGQKPLRELFD